MNRRLLFILAATLLSLAAALLAARGIYRGFEYFHAENVINLRRFDAALGFLFDPRYRRLRQLVQQERLEGEPFQTVWDTNVGIMLSRRMFRPVEMFGTAKYAYQPNLRKVSFRAHTGSFYHQGFEMADSPAVRAALPQLNISELTHATYDERGFRRVDSGLTRDCRTHVLFLGDSFTDGLGVQDSETFVNRYGWLMREQSHLPVCPVNAGVNGYGSLEEAWVLEHVFDLTGRAPLVVVMYYPNDVDENYGLVLDGTLPDLDRKWAISLSYLRRMAEFSRREGATLLLVIIAPQDQFADVSSVPHYNDVLRRFGRQEGVRVLDLLPAMKQYKASDLFLPEDLHWTPFGHKVVAEILYQHTRELLATQPGSR